MSKFRTMKIRLVKSMFFKTSLYRHFLPVMKFDMSIAQLNSIIENIREIKGGGQLLKLESVGVQHR